MPRREPLAAPAAARTRLCGFRAPVACAWCLGAGYLSRWEADLILQLFVLAVLALIILGLVANLGARFRTTIFEYERGLHFSRGRFTRVLDPGVYWSLPAFVRIQRVDVRPARTVVAGQEVLSADGVAVKGSVMATYQVVDPRQALLASDDFRAAVYSELQLALRTVISETRIDDLLQQRAQIPARLNAIAGEKTLALGVELQDASLRDLTFPCHLTKIFTQLVNAPQEALATPGELRAAVTEWLLEPRRCRPQAAAALRVKRRTSLASRSLGVGIVFSSAP